MRKLVIALLMPMLTIGLTGCEDEGGFVNKEETIQVSIMTWDFNRNPTSTVAANTGLALPNLKEFYTLHVAVNVWKSDGSPADDGTIVNISFDPSGYGSLSRAGGQEGDDEEYDYFHNCDTTTLQCYYMLSNSGRVTSGMAQFFFTSNDLTCSAADQPCVNLRATVRDPVTGNEVYATKPIVVW